MTKPDIIEPILGTELDTGRFSIIIGTRVKEAGCIECETMLPDVNLAGHVLRIQCNSCGQQYRRTAWSDPDKPPSVANFVSGWRPSVQLVRTLNGGWE